MDKRVILLTLITERKAKNSLSNSCVSLAFSTSWKINHELLYNYYTSTPKPSLLAPVVQTLDSTIQRVSDYRNQLRYSVIQLLNNWGLGLPNRQKRKSVL